MNQRIPNHWQHIDGALVASFRPVSFTAGAEFVLRIATIADEVNHHPELTLEYGLLTVRLFSHDAANTVTDRDLKLAQRIDQAAGEEGVFYSD